VDLFACVLNPLPIGPLPKQSIGTGCPGTPMARSPPLCLPTIFTDMTNTAQSSARQPQMPVGCPKLAREALVSSDAQASGWRSMVLAQEARPALAAGGPHLASEPGTPEDMRMASEEPDPLLRVCNQVVIKTVMLSRAPFTRAIYANRWKIFSEWCRAHKEVPGSSSVPIILCFLQSLREKKETLTLRV